MTMPEDLDSTIEELLPEQEAAAAGDDAGDIVGTFQVLASLGGYLGVYEELSSPSKEELVAALAAKGVKTAPADSVYDFVLVGEEATRGLIRSKDGSWIDQDVEAAPDGEVSGGYGVYTKLASFLGLYDRYGLDRPSAHQLREALINYGVRDGPDEGADYIAPVQGADGEEYLVGISTGQVTTAFPIDDAGHHVGSEEYTRDLFPKLVDRLEEEAEFTGSESFAPELPEEVGNLLEDEAVAEAYQVMMHRLAEQAAGENVPAAIRERRLAEARFITEVLTGERSWDS